jgi:long-chain fatty acid transport protein
MTYRNCKLSTLMLGLGGGLLAASGGAWAAGFALLEQNVSGLGNAYAGQAASAQDASTIFFNPAGMTLLPDRQVVLSAIGIKPSATFSNTGSSAPFPRPTLTGNGGDAGDWALVPGLYAAFAITPDLRVGIGVNSPFGLKTDYDTPWLGQYQAIHSKLETVNVNPSVAYRLNSVVSLGAGASWQRAKAELTQTVFFGPAGDGVASVEGDHNAWGYNVGALFQLGDDMRIGVAYRSNIKQDLDGTVTFARPAGIPNAGPARDGPVTASVNLPDTASVSVFQRFGDKWDLMGDITWTHWKRFKDLTVVRTDAAGGVLESQVENWDDTWRFSLGLNYHASQQLTLRFGTSYDQSPVPDANRTARIPDNDRVWGAIGLQYAFTPGLLLDVGYAHLFVRKSTINQPNTLTGVPAAFSGQLVGNYDNSVDIVGVQLTWSF